VRVAFAATASIRLNRMVSTWEGRGDAVVTGKIRGNVRAGVGKAVNISRQ